MIQFNEPAKNAGSFRFTRLSEVPEHSAPVLKNDRAQHTRRESAKMY